MTQAKEILNKHEPEIGYKRDFWYELDSEIKAAINEALQVGLSEGDKRDTQNQYVIKHYESVLTEMHTRIAELEDENRKLRETLDDDPFKKLYQSLKDNLK